MTAHDAIKSERRRKEEEEDEEEEEEDSVKQLPTSASDTVGAQRKKRGRKSLTKESIPLEEH